mgnify:CR=1 FL=1
MKKGYHDYTPIVIQEKKQIEVKKIKATHEPKYITAPSGIKHMISDERGMVVAATDILMLGAKAPSINYVRPLNVDFKMSTKDYIKYNGKL